MSYSRLPILILLLLILEGLTNAVPTTECSPDIISQAQAQAHLLVGLNSTCDQPIPPDEIPNNYIVALNMKSDLKEHISQLNKFIAGHTSYMDRAIDNKVTGIHDTMTAKYYLGIFDTRVIEFIKSSEGVVSVSLDREIEPFAVTVQKDATWNLARITVPGNFESKDRCGTKIGSQDFLYPYEEDAGVNTRIYIMDYGVRGTHVEFQEKGHSRVECGVDISDPNGRGDNDTLGHGTAVASVAAGKQLGIAKKATIIPVKLAAKPSDLVIGHICEGLKWIIADFTAKKNSGPGVISITVSLNGVAGFADLFREAIKKGLHVVTVAGNDNQDDCENQPVNVGQFHIGATGPLDDRWEEDDRSQGSNNGACVTMYAPGKWICVAQIASDKAKAERSGTSLATPLVAGIIATIASREPTLTPSDMKTRVEGMGLQGRITGLKPGDNNILLQSPTTSLPPNTACLSKEG